MPPTNQSVESETISQRVSQDLSKKSFKFIFRDAEYDCTEYAQKHPGGLEFFEKQIQEKPDISEYFLALHSQKAEKIMKSLPKTGKTVKQSEDSIFYDELNEKVKHLYKNNYLIDFGYLAFVLSAFLIGCFASNPFIAFIGLFTSQIVSGWLCHSWAHGRDQLLYKFVDIFSPIVAGVSTKWWNRKHNLHHMFTNVYGKDEDIQHNYFRALFGFLYMKWNYDSMVFDFKSKRFFLLLLHFIFMFNQNVILVFIAQYAAGFFSAHILIGNHEKEKTFEGKHGLNFLSHQIITARDYDYHGLFWVTYMGGMQYQTEHHIFPQIPFYNLPALRQILVKELAKKQYTIKVDGIFD